MEILILTGAPGVGKSSLAKAWAIENQGVTIQGDVLSNWIYKKDFPKWNEEAERFLAQLAAKIAIEYLSKNLPVVIDYVWTPVGIKIIKDSLHTTSNTKCNTIWLTCTTAENRRRDAQRIPDHQMKERVSIVQAELEACDWPEEVLRLDTTEMEVTKILQYIKGF